MTLDPFERAAQEAWERLKTPLDRMYDRWMGEDAWLPDPPRTTFRLYEQATGLPIRCHLCGSTDNWVVEGDEERRIVRVFVCEHEPVAAGRGMIRQIATVRTYQIERCEPTGEYVS